jgi:integrase
VSNIVYEDKMYDENRKNKFIDQYGSGTGKTLSRIFKVSQVVEYELGKDLSDFTREELKRLFYSYTPKTVYSSKANVTWVSKYIDWSIAEGYTKGINPLSTIDTEWKEQFANKNLKKYWTDKEISDIVSVKIRANYQDGAIVVLLFSGIRGAGNSEILNLRKKDVDRDKNILHVRDEDGSERDVFVSEECIRICLKAYEETEYEKMNGNASPDIKAPRAQLVDNDFIVKSVNTNTKNFNEAEKNIVHRRLSKIAAELDEPLFTPMNLYYSGMIALCKDLYASTGRLDDEEYSIVFSEERFNEKSEQSRYRLKNDFLNLETLKSIYPDI